MFVRPYVGLKLMKQSVSVLLVSKVACAGFALLRMSAQGQAGFCSFTGYTT